MNDGDIVEIEELNLKLNSLRNCVEAIPVVKKYKKVIKFRKKGIFNLAYSYKQGLFLQKIQKV